MLNLCSVSPLFVIPLHCVLIQPDAQYSSYVHIFQFLVQTTELLGHSDLFACD